MALQYSPFAVISIIAGIIAALIAGFIWTRRPGQGVMSFVILMLGLVVWSFAAGMELISTVIPLKVFASSMAYFGITIVPSALFVFVLEYIGREAWVNRRNLQLLAIYPIATLIAVMTNPWHQLFYPEITLDPMYTDIVLEYGHGILFWMQTCVAYSLTLASTYLLLRTFARSPQLYRGQITLMTIGILTPLVANILFVFGYSPIPPYVDATPIAFTFTGAVAAWTLYRYKLLDLIPVAHDAVFQSMEDAVFVFDTQYRVLDANQAAGNILNLPVAKLIGEGVEDLFSASLDILDKYRDVDRTDDDITLPLNGENRTFQLRISPLYNSYGDLSGRTAILHDITQLKEQNEALRIARDEANESARLKSQFLATMSHELRTPLNAIIGYTDLMLAGMAGDLSDTQYKYSERTLSNAQHLLGLINDILDISKIEAGRVEIIQQPINVRDWADTVVTQNSVLAEKKELGFDVEIDEQLPETIIGDSAKLYQIVVNLLGNAVKFTEKGRISFSLRRSSETTWKIVVKDTGIGIAPHDQETIFNEFHQVDGSSTRQFGGTGLGLAIVRKLVLLMGGNVRVSSTLGEGSTFTVTLPIAPVKTEVTT